MTGINGAKYKLMPVSPNIDLKIVEKKAKKIVEKFGGTNKEYSIEPIAFGLKALIVFFFYPEDKNTEELIDKFQKIENVSSAELIDMRKIAWQLKDFLNNWKKLNKLHILEVNNEIKRDSGDN